MPLVDMLLQELDQESVATRRVLERVPQAHLGWQPHPKAMTLGQLAMHVATIPGIIAQMAALPVFEMRPFVQSAATRADELVPALETSLATARTVLAGMDDATVMGTWTMTSGGRDLLSMPRAAMLRTIMLNHWYHHRGQLSTYLRQLGVALPSIYGPSADENPFTTA